MLLLGCTPANTPNAPTWDGFDDRAQQTIHRLRRVKDLGDVGLEYDRHRVLAHSRAKAVWTALLEVECVLCSQLVTIAFGTWLSRFAHNPVARVSSLFAR
jgi:hypothetical protein